MDYTSKTLPLRSFFHFQFFKYFKSPRKLPKYIKIYPKILFHFYSTSTLPLLYSGVEYFKTTRKTTRVVSKLLYFYSSSLLENGVYSTSTRVVSKLLYFYSSSFENYSAQHCEEQTKKQTI